MRRKRPLLLVATMALAARCICAADQLRCSGWELVNPRPQANHLRDVAFGGGRWVAVGEGTAVASKDAVAWSAVPLPGVSLRGVAYGDGVFVAVGAGGVIVRSGDGVAWHAAGPVTSADLVGMAFNGERYVAPGGVHPGLSESEAGRFPVYVSEDGLSWRSLPALMPVTREGTAAIASDGSGFVAVRGTSVLTSADGLARSSADSAPRVPPVLAEPTPARTSLAGRRRSYGRMI